MIKMKNILVVSSNRLGDCILSSGLHQYFKKNEKNSKVTLVCGEIPSELFKYCNYVDELIILKKKKFALHWFFLWKKIFLKKWDRIVDLRGTIISFFLFSKENFRYKNSKKSKNHKVYDISQSITKQILPPSINLQNNKKLKGTNFKKIKDLSKTNNFIMIAPTANWTGKIWPQDRFLKLITILKKKSKFKKTIFIIVGPLKEKHLVQNIFKSNQTYIYDLFGKSSLIEIFYIMKLCNLFIGNDSGLMHMASLAKIKTIGLFGPSDRDKYRPWGSQNVVISSSKGPDDLMGHKNFKAKGSDSLMLDLSVDKVLKEVMNNSGM